MDEKTLGKRLQLARRRAGLTQQELCQKAGLSYSTLAKIERGAIRSPSVFTVASIANATQTPLEDLLDLRASQLKSPTPAETKKRSKSGVRFVYFDINGVLVRFFHSAFSEIARASDKPADLIETVFWRYNDAVCKGQTSLKELNSTLGKELDIKDFDWQKYYLSNVEAMPGMEDLVRWTAKYYEVGLLSNTMPGFIEALQAEGLIPKVNYTAIVDSSKVGIVKPEPKIYVTAQQLAAMEPAEILFIDESRANLNPADRAGWHVLRFDDYNPEESIERIKQSLAF